MTMKRARPLPTRSDHQRMVLLCLVAITFAYTAVLTIPPAVSAPASNRVFKDCDRCPEMVTVPAGSFFFGTQPDPSQPAAEAANLKRITYAQPFAVGRYAVTFDEWDACVADGGCNGYRPDDDGWGRGRHPVINISVADAGAYTIWLSRKTGQKYRLPTPEEREYFTRAGTTTAYWWGDNITPQQANYNGDYPNYDTRAPEDVYRRKTLPVDSFSPNPWGLYQVHGNVWEWVDRCEMPTRGPPYCEVRGGSWASKPFELASFSYREMDDTVRGIGFRVVRDLADADGKD
jgi:formylglycine-generating enzyme required for sulfatase activity